MRSVNRGACLTLKWDGRKRFAFACRGYVDSEQRPALPDRWARQSFIGLLVTAWRARGGSWFFCSLTGEGTFVLDRSFMKVNDMRADDRWTLVVGMTSRSVGGISFDDMTSALGRDVLYASLAPGEGGGQRRRGEEGGMACASQAGGGRGIAIYV